MIALIQRVSSAQVQVDQQIIGKIGQGILLLLAVEKNDNQQIAEKLVNKLLAYRIFSDEQGKMNLNVQQVAGSLLIVSQFTLAANTRQGLRPSFSEAAPPALAQALYQQVVQLCQARLPTQTGEFAADMQVSLTNDGPVTFYLQVTH